ncbi:type II toxin-antitoxin system HicB family antitoxin [Lysobacter xanthus]
MGYFAFVRRDAARRYHATLPDFPDCIVEAERLDTLEAAIRGAVQGAAAGGGWPPPTRLEALPRPPDGAEGYWLMVDVDGPGVE